MLTMKTKPFATWWLAAAAVAVAFFAQAVSAQNSSRMLPFQGRLTGATGNPIPDGSRVVQFKIYDAPVGGRAVWNGEVHNLTVNAGLVSTLLGTKATLEGVDFNQDLYLEITIDANGDSQITLADPPLLPRQSVLPAVFAKESANTRLLNGYDWSSLFGTNNPADGALLESKIGDNSVTTSKIRDASITSAKIADGAVTHSKLDTSGAAAGQSLTYNGTSVVWSQVNALNAQTLNGFDWSTIFSGGNPQSGTMSVQSLVSRNTIAATDSLTVSGRTFLNGPSTSVAGSLTAANITGTTDITAYQNMWAKSFNVTSDRNAKENFAELDAQEVLGKVIALPVTRWNFRSENPDVKHIGPMAQDFQAAFKLSADDRHISIVDEGGVALAAIQALNKKLEANDNELRRLVQEQQQEIKALKTELGVMKASRE
jgi:hypothetical protein